MSIKMNSSRNSAQLSTIDDILSKTSASYRSLKKFSTIDAVFEAMNPKTKSARAVFGEARRKFRKENFPLGSLTIATTAIMIALTVSLSLIFRAPLLSLGFLLVIGFVTIYAGICAAFAEFGYFFDNYLLAEEWAIIGSRLSLKARRKVQQKQNEEKNVAQNFLNEHQAFSKLFEAFEKLSKDSDENSFALQAIREEWKNLIAQEKLKRQEASRVAFYLEEAERLGKERAQAEWLHKEREQKKAAANKLIEDLRREIEVDENGLVLSESSSLNATNKMSVKSNIQDEVRTIR